MSNNSPFTFLFPSFNALKEPLYTSSSDLFPVAPHVDASWTEWLPSSNGHDPGFQTKVLIER